MVDREARNKMAELLRHFVARQITDSELDLNLPHSKIDHTAQRIADVLEINYERLWGRPQHIGQLSENERRQLARVAAYLYTDLEWSMTGTWWKKLKTPPIDLWPFSSNEEYEEALKHPRLLHGKQTH